MLIEARKLCNLASKAARKNKLVGSLYWQDLRNAGVSFSNRKSTKKIEVEDWWFDALNDFANGKEK